MADYSGFAAAVLRGIGAPVTRQNIAGFIGWSEAEGPLGGDSWARHNPLNTTQGAPGAGSINSVGVKRYINEQQGIQATISTLKNGHYDGILQAFHANNPSALGGAIGASPWGTSGALATQTIAQALHKPWSVPAGGSAPQGAPSVRVPSGSGTTSVKITGGGYLDKHAVAQAVLQKEVSRPITSGLHGNPLEEFVHLAQTGQYNVPTSTTTVKLKGQGGQRPATMQARKAPAGAGLPNGLATFDGKQVAAWILPALQYARAHGWKGTVSSGYRSDAEQTRIYNSGVRPAALPRSLGGSGSNHEGTKFPAGAVDATDAPALSAILERSPYAKLLLWAGGKDPVHFSHPHNGGY